MHADALLVGAIRQQWQLIRHWHSLRVREPAFAIHGGRTRLGLWMRAQRTISISREHALNDPWPDVAETVLHEVAHQIVDEQWGGDSTPHGPRFQRVLHDLGALPSEIGEVPPVIDRVRKLLALAGSPNRHEAELAMAKAQRLMIQHRVEAAAAERSQGVIRRSLGVARARQSRWRCVLAGLVGEQFFVEVIRMPAYLPADDAWGTIWEIAGRPADVEMASYAYDFVSGTAERLWVEHLARHPGAGRSRDRFLLGVVTGFQEKLRAGVREAREQGLVLVPDHELKAAWDRRIPKRSSSGGGSVVIDAHYHAGREAGGHVVLHRPVEGGSGGGGGLLEG